MRRRRSALLHRNNAMLKHLIIAVLSEFQPFFAIARPAAKLLSI
jgi:hypothetical protein